MATSSSVWFGSALFLSLGFFSILAAMLPLGLSADSLIMPDLFFCMTFYWVVRSAKTAPITLIFGIVFFADVMLARPLGLWTLIVVLAMEFTRYQRFPIREQMFIVEWILFALLFGVSLLINALLLMLSFSSTPDLDLSVQFFGMTVLTYPLVMLVLHYIFRIRAEQAPKGNNRLGRVQ